MYCLFFVGNIQMHLGDSSLTSDPFVDSTVGSFPELLLAPLSVASSSNPGLYTHSSDDDSPAELPYPATGLLCAEGDLCASCRWTPLPAIHYGFHSIGASDASPFCWSFYL